MKKVDFVICGTQKGGTNALTAYLREHRQVCVAKIKEVHFFDNEENFRDGKPDYSRYHAAFSRWPWHKVAGEATPIYMYWRDAPRRIWQYNPDMKVVVILRNPISRAYSHWNMERSRNWDSLPFGEAIRRETERCREALPYQHPVFSYVDRGFYLEQLRRLWAYFPREQVLVLRNEDLKARPDETLGQLCDFIGVRPFRKIKDKGVSRYSSSPMDAADKDYLRAIYEDEIRGIERELGWDCSNWLQE